MSILYYLKSLSVYIIQGYQAIRQDNAPPPYYQPPVVHDNIYQPVPHDQIQRQPIPNTVPAAVHKPPVSVECVTCTIKY